MMKSLEVSITSCIGGKNDQFTVQVKQHEQKQYFVYKTLDDFCELWESLGHILLDENNHVENVRSDASVTTKWMQDFLLCYNFQQNLRQLHTDQKELMNVLDNTLSLLIRRISVAYMENLLHFNCCPLSQKVVLLLNNFLQLSKYTSILEVTPTVSTFQRKRCLSEVRPVSKSHVKPSRSTPLFPVTSCQDDMTMKLEQCKQTTAKTRSNSLSYNTMMYRSVVSSTPTRARAFAEGNFSNSFISA